MKRGFIASNIHKSKKKKGQIQAGLATEIVDPAEMYLPTVKKH